MAVSQTPPRVGSLRSPLTPLLSPFRRNNDDEERARMRALQAKAKRKSLLPSSGPGGGGDNQNESEGYSADRLKTMFDSCVKLAAENVSTRFPSCNTTTGQYDQSGIASFVPLQL